MEGLEISIKRLSEVLTDNPTFRFDSEYFKKEYLEIFKILGKKETEKTTVCTKWITQGPNPKFNEDGDIPCLTGRNINKGTVTYTNPDFIDEEEYEKLKRFQLKHGDTLITLKGKGSIGHIGYVTDSRKAIFSRNIGIIRPDKIDSGYLNAFILSFYGVKLIERGETGGTGQSTLTTEYLKNIDVPRLKIESEIGNLVELSEQVLRNSQETYKQAEKLLLETLGLADFQPSQEPINVKSFSESFGSSSRLDAEYYQIKYEDYETLITNYKGSHEPFEIACSLKDKNFNPKDKIKYKYIELTNIGKLGEITGCTTGLGEELPTRARRKVATNDVVVSSIEGSLDSCALVSDEYNNALCSTGFFVVNSKKLNPETLLVLFKSEPIQALLKKGCSGTILTAISKAELSKIPIPLIDKATQEAIKKKINESFKLKKQSEHLLEVAKTTVEMAIEQNEQAAIQFINQNVN